MEKKIREEILGDKADEIREEITINEDIQKAYRENISNMDIENVIRESIVVIDVFTEEEKTIKEILDKSN